MKRHHLDEIIEKMEYCDEDLDFFEILLTILKEVKELDQCFENLSNEMRNHDP